MNKLTIKREDATFANIKKIIGKSLDRFEFDIEGGKEKILAQVKITIKNGLIKTAYLHATLIYATGKTTFYREQKDGSFKS